jgi:capsular polysaccharide biosynthesis protein
MIEHLARLVQIDNVIDASIPVVVSDRLSSAALDVVRAVTDREIIVAPVAERTRFGSLILPSNAVLHTDTLELPWHIGTSIDFMAVDELARRILRSRGSLNSESPRRIFWHRDSMYRNLTNQDELIEVAKRWGFTVIHPETCSLSDQVTLFRNAEAVITAMGAVTPNYLFMQPGAHIVSFTSQASADYVFPGVIGHHVTGSFRTLIGEYKKSGEERSRLDYFHQPFHIEPALLEDELSRILDRH